MTNHIEQVDRMIEVVTRDRIQSLSDSSGVQDIAPIFVCGMPRSGTTLTELMLSRHSQVQAGGELQAALRALGQVRPLVDYLEGNGGAEPTADMFTQVGEYYVEAVRREGLTQEIVTDKLPINHLYVGLLALALPRAKFVILERHPLDCCLSNWTQHFGRNQA
ncbi:MAG: sulfotransferase [Pseudomonadota bacterium]